jgi:parallel beta-helix repeat protein
VLRNQTSGNGYVFAANPNFGIGILAPATENLVSDNIVTGNLTGVRLGAGTSGNIVRGNVIAGNPPILVSNNVAENSPFAFDILNMSSTGANTFENNLCVTAMNAPCSNLKPGPDVTPIVSGLVFNPARVTRGGSFNAAFSGSNLTTTTYFDLRYRPPGASSDEITFNWQRGGSASQIIPPSTAPGDWMITGIRAHQDANDHSGPFEPVQTALTIISAPF